MKLGMEVGLGPGHIVLDGDPAPTKGAQPPPFLQFSAYVCCGQTAGWIKIPLGTEVDLGPGHIVLAGDMMGVILRVELRRYHERTFRTPFYLLPSAPLLAALS